jgi:hypothetical protein
VAFLFLMHVAIALVTDQALARIAAAGPLARAAAPRAGGAHRATRRAG